MKDDELNWEDVEVHEGHAVKMLWRENIATYNLQVFAPAIDYEDVRTLTEQDKRVLADLPAMLEELEELVENKLPEGYRVRITEWNK